MIIDQKTLFILSSIGMCNVSIREIYEFPYTFLRIVRQNVYKITRQ